jgi:hypothetical protein
MIDKRERAAIFKAIVTVMREQISAATQPVEQRIVQLEEEIRELRAARDLAARELVHDGQQRRYRN